MDREIEIPFECFGEGIEYNDLSNGDTGALFTSEIVIKQFVLTIFSDEWKQGETIVWALSSCPNTGCDITVYKYPDGRIIAHCSDCGNERGLKIV